MTSQGVKYARNVATLHSYKKILEKFVEKINLVAVSVFF